MLLSVSIRKLVGNFLSSGLFFCMHKHKHAVRSICQLWPCKDTYPVPPNMNIRLSTIQQQCLRLTLGHLPVTVDQMVQQSVSVLNSYKSLKCLSLFSSKPPKNMIRFLYGTFQQTAHYWICAHIPPAPSTTYRLFGCVVHMAHYHCLCSSSPRSKHDSPDRTRTIYCNKTIRRCMCHRQCPYDHRIHRAFRRLACTCENRANAAWNRLPAL